jgi:phage baseplate assembly protein W
MAQRKENFYNPLDLEKDIAIGVMLPFGTRGGGLFNLSYTTEEQAISNLKNLLLTRKGERPFQPNFGSTIPSLLFEPMNTDLETSIDESLREDIRFWLPYIVVDEIESNVDFDRNSINVRINFRVTEQGANTQIILFVDSAGTTDIQ